MNYNGVKFLKDCFESLIRQSFRDFEIIFVDNASTDGSVEFMKENFTLPFIKIVTSKRNLGFAGGNNLGLSECSGEFIVLLNNDTTVDKFWLEKLIDCIEPYRNTGIAQSLVYTEGIPLKYYEMNGTINLLGHNIMRVFEIGKDGIGEIFQATGCSLIIRKELVKSLGEFFPEEYFAYSEDTFLCFSVKFRGLKIMHTSESIVYHKGGGASKDRKASHLFFYQERNRLLNFLLFFSGSFILKYIPYLIFNFFMKLILSVFKKKYSAVQLIKAYLWFFTNFKWIRNKRSEVKLNKRVNSSYVMRYISGKIFNGDNFFERLINFISISYCKITDITVLENKKTA
ncbi:MAG: glycosyltransferase family 2 protein [Ignavibacteria bacterium]|nr:glycosyltransferase family 2 protein [Ignavibacteria bacterium]